METSTRHGAGEHLNVGSSVILDELSGLIIISLFEDIVHDSYITLLMILCQYYMRSERPVI